MIILLCMLSFALAEPPVGDSYLEAAKLSQDHSSHQQYLPTDLTVPSARTPKSFNALSSQYLPASTRRISQEYGPPDARERPSSEYGLPTRGTSIFRSRLSQEYGTPMARTTQHGSLNSDIDHSISSIPKSGVSQTYAPSSRNSPSGLYSSPLLRSSPSSQYGTPQLRSSNKYATRTSPVQKYGVPSGRTNQPHSKIYPQSYGAALRSNPQQSLGYPSGFSSRLQNSQFQGLGNPAQSYGTPSARNAVNGYGRSSKTSGSNTNAYSSSYPSARSPSLEYGVPSSRAIGLSQEYGAPEGSLDEGYDYSRNALENQNLESANYDFAYKVNDEDTGSDFGHSETRQLDRTEGAYFVLLPDGTKQIVEYEADENGFKPRISIEHVDSATAFTASGPY